MHVYIYIFIFHNVIHALAGAGGRGEKSLSVILRNVRRRQRRVHYKFVSEIVLGRVVVV